MFWVTKSYGTLYPLYWKRGYFLRPLLHLWVCIIPWWHVIFSDGLPVLPSSCLVAMGRFCKVLGTSTLQEEWGLSQRLPAASLDEATEMGATGLGDWPKHHCQSFPQWPTFSFSCCSQLLVDTDSCCCLSVGFALFCFNLSASFMCLN